MIEATEFRTVGGRLWPWESLLPPELLRVPAELARVDALLDDPAFFAPFAPYFHPVLGRPSTPIECYLRLMFLKFRYRMGYLPFCVASMVMGTACHSADRRLGGPFSGPSVIQRDATGRPVRCRLPLTRGMAYRGDLHRGRA